MPATNAPVGDKHLIVTTRHFFTFEKRMLTACLPDENDSSTHVNAQL
jgi:hypothetical protein